MTLSEEGTVATQRAGSNQKLEIGSGWWGRPKIWNAKPAWATRPIRRILSLQNPHPGDFWNLTKPKGVGADVGQDSNWEVGAGGSEFRTSLGFIPEAGKFHPQGSER